MFHKTPEKDSYIANLSKNLMDHEDRSGDPHYDSTIKHVKAHSAGSEPYTKFLLKHGEDVKENPNFSFPKDKVGKEHHEVLKPLKKHIKGLDSYLEGAHPVKQDFHVYSSLRSQPHERYEGNKLFMHHENPSDQDHHKVFMPSYASSSIDPNESRTFSRHYAKNGVGHMLKIHVPAGSNHGSYIEKHSRFPSEKEFLFKRGTMLHVSKTPEIHKDSLGETHVWHAKIVGNIHGDKNPSKNWTDNDIEGKN